MSGTKRNLGISKAKATIKEFTLEDIRCFEGPNVFKIKPLTFLVGENSTGKSTVLGCFQALMDFRKSIPKPSIDFNASMGSFYDIARRSKAEETVEKFKLGFTFENEQNFASFNITLVEREGSFEPVLKKEKWEFTDGKIVIEPSKDDEKTRGNFDVKYKDNNGKKEFLIQSWQGFLRLLLVFESSLSDEEQTLSKKNGFTRDEEMCLEFLKKHKSIFDRSVIFSRINTVRAESFAPIRAKPKRTYDPSKETGDSEGGDMPMIVMKMSKFNKGQWKKIEKKLKKFGKSSGLFSEILPGQPHKEMGGSFQLKIKVQGTSANMVDVGYGVSQILPILVRVFKAKKKTTFLLQQPEVHLHPCAQAELSSLLAQITQQKDGHNFLIETHSDYMIDRARIEITQKNIHPEDVALIYLEYKDNKTKVHNISFDKNANMVGVPPSYRQFFMRETDRLLGFD